MNTVKLISSAVAAAAVLMAGAVNAAPSADVAKVVNVKGSVVVEAANGVRQMARSGMTLPEGSRLIVLEKAAAELAYNTTQCRINHGQNTLLQVTEVAQCAAGQQIAVGQAAAGASASAGASTTTAGVAGSAAAGTGAAAGGAAAGASAAAGAVAGGVAAGAAGLGIGLTTVAVVGGVAALGAAVNAAQDDGS